MTGNKSLLKHVFNILMLLSIMTTHRIYATQICDFRLTDCPETFSNQIIYVPKNVLSLSSDFYVCQRTSIIEGTVTKNAPPSIMFVIDHSGTMTGINTNTSPRDSGGTRFKVTGAIIDSIYNIYPNAEVGVIVFQEVLYFDTRDNKEFMPLPAGYPSPAGYETQGYIPLLRLDSTLSSGEKSIDFIKRCLETKVTNVTTSIRSTNTTTDLVYHPRFLTLGNTNINTPFDAVRAAMQKSRYDKKNQFVIFMSDGEPYPEKNAADLHGGKNYLDFVNGINLPATFTVFFNPDSKTPPRSLSTMTKNIQSNNYSENNSKSNIWTINTSYSTLLELLMTNVISSMLQSVNKNPVSLILNEKTFKNYQQTDSTFFIPNGYPLNDSLTHFDITIQYQINNTTLNTKWDSLVTFAFDVVRTDRMPQSSGILVNCNDTILYKVEIHADDPSASETANDPGKVSLSRNNSNGNLNVYYKVTGTAKNGVDYSSITDSALFTNGNSQIVINITPLTDSLKEQDETVIIKLLSSKTNRQIEYTLTQRDSAVVTIHDRIPDDTLNIVPLVNPFSIDDNLKDKLSTIFKTGSTNNLNSFMKIITSNQGTIISIKSSTPLKALSSDNTVYGKGVIYDALGNIVKHVAIYSINKDSGFYGIYWDGTTMNNRCAGYGIYLLKMYFTTGNNESFTPSLKIGIKKTQ